MSIRPPRELAALLWLLAGATVVALELWQRSPRAGRPFEVTGTTVIILGCLLAFWAIVHLRWNVAGAIKPRAEKLVVGGPFRFVRHPVYVGFGLILLGGAIKLQSWMGLVAAFVVYLPATILRARFEDEALREKFGEEWVAYANHVGMLFPRFLKER